MRRAQNIKQMNQHPDFTRYLCFILGQPEITPAVRAVAGLLLKNNVLALYAQLAPDIVEVAAAHYLLLLATIGRRCVFC